MRLKLACAGLVILVQQQLWAQASTPEVFGHVGLFRAGSDEGALGSAASVGGALTAPVSRRLAANIDVQTSKVARIRTADSFYRTRRTLILPGLLYRWGSDRAYGFVAGGIGAEFANSVTREDDFIAGYTPRGWREIRPRVFETKSFRCRADSVRASRRCGVCHKAVGSARRRLRRRLACGHKNRTGIPIRLAQNVPTTAARSAGRENDGKTARVRHRHPHVVPADSLAP